MLGRLIRASAVAGTAPAVAACSVSPVKMGDAAITGGQRISIATLNNQVTNLSQAVRRYPGVVTLTPLQQTQQTLTWLVRYQINDELARQNAITVTTAQAQAARRRSTRRRRPRRPRRA